ncbi:MAG TPA: polysaccharide biosynthesis tyrosine autokinase [Cytophagales bacterium]|nr:polysaccharide biosynthesis tyrosine autokinase [Cytophagales bacterium]
MKNKSQENSIDIKYLLFKVTRKWYVVVLCLVISLVAAYIYLQTTTDIYRVKASLFLDNESKGSKQVEELLNAMDMMGKGVKMEDEVGLITSTTMVERTLEKLDFDVSYFQVKDSWINTFSEVSTEEIYKDAPFTVILDKKSNQIINVPVYINIVSDELYELKVDGEDVNLFNFQKNSNVLKVSKVEFRKTILFGEPFNNNYLGINIVRNKNVALKKGAKFYFKINNPNQMVRSYQSRIVAKPFDRESHILEITSEGPVKEKEVDFLNTLLEVFIQYNLDEKQNIGQKTVNFIEEQIALIGDSLKHSSVALESYQSTNRIMDVQNASSNVYDRLDKLESERATTTMSLTYYEDILSSLKSDKNFNKAVLPSTVGIDNPILSGLLVELSNLYRERAGLNYSAKEGNPLVRVIDAKIKNTKQSLITNLDNVIKATRQSLKYTNQRIGNIDEIVNRLPKNERKLVDLQRKFDYNEKMYNFLLERYAEGSIALATNESDRKLIDKAKVEGGGPIAPKRKMILLIAGFLGFCLPIGFILFKDKLNEKVITKEDLQTLTRIPVLGIIAHSTSSIKLPLVYNPRSAVAESFRSVRINLQYLFSDYDQKVIGVTSSIGGEGKTFCSINLSADFALSGKKTLLIDADLRKPKIAQYLNLNNKAGLSTYLDKTTDLSESIISSDVTNLDIMPSGPIPGNSLSLLTKPEFRYMLSILSEKYDYIVIDTPPTCYVSDYFVLMDFINTSLYVVRSNYTDKAMISQIDELYVEKKVKNICMLINDMDFKDTYGYKYKSDAHKYYMQA